MAASSTPAPAGPSARPKLTLDEARDFLYTSMRTLERFSSELKGTVDALDGLKQNGAWLDTAQEQFAKGARLMDDQARQWQQTTARMEAYMSSVRDLADQLALQGRRAHSCNHRLRRADECRKAARREVPAELLVTGAPARARGSSQRTVCPCATLCAATCCRAELKGASGDAEGQVRSEQSLLEPRSTCPYSALSARFCEGHRRPVRRVLHCRLRTHASCIRSCTASS